MIDEFIESLQNGETKLDNNQIVEIAMTALVENEHINCDRLSEVITSLRSVKKTAGEDWKLIKKEEREVSNNAKAERGKRYFESLKVGDPVSWVLSSGDRYDGTVGEPLKDTKTAHVILKELPAYSKAAVPKLDRHVKYHQIEVPEDWEEE